MRGSTGGSGARSWLVERSLLLLLSAAMQIDAYEKIFHHAVMPHVRHEHVSCRKTEGNVSTLINKKALIGIADTEIGPTINGHLFVRINTYASLGAIVMLFLFDQQIETLARPKQQHYPFVQIYIFENFENHRPPEGHKTIIKRKNFL